MWVALDNNRDLSSMPCRAPLRNLLPPIDAGNGGSRIRFEPSERVKVVTSRSNQAPGLAAAWSRAAIPSNKAPKVEAASAGASMTTLPPTSRRTRS
jgi:hypothetical protein